MGLKLTIIGSAAAWAEGPCRPSSCYLLEIADEAIVLDLGQGSLGALFAYRDPSTIAAVVISHMHPDHHVDLVPLRHVLRYHYREPRTIGLHLPSGLRERYDVFLGEPGFLDDLPGADVTEGIREIGRFRVQAARVTHSQQSHAFRVSDAFDRGGPGLVYSGDCGRADDLLALIQPGDTALIEAFWSTVEPEPDAFHLTAAEAAEVARSGGAAHLILTHILESHDPAAGLRTAEGIFAGPVELAEPGMVIEVGAHR